MFRDVQIKVRITDDETTWGVAIPAGGTYGLGIAPSLAGAADYAVQTARALDAGEEVLTNQDAYDFFGGLAGVAGPSDG